MKITKKPFIALSILTALQISSKFILAASTMPTVVVTVPTGYALSIGSLISALLTLIMVIAALLVFLYLIWGGIEWVSSGGDKGKVENARNKITAAVIGLIVIAASWAILTLALNFLGFEGFTDVFDKMKTISE